MDKTKPPETLGVFKPVGHTVMAFRSDADLQVAANALRGLGFANADLVCYTPQEMINQATAERRRAGALATFGYELDLVNAHLALAENGCSFLVVYAPETGQAERAAKVARALHAVAAQHYGTFMIEELVSTSAADIPEHSWRAPSDGGALGRASRR